MTRIASSIHSIRVYPIGPFCTKLVATNLLDRSGLVNSNSAAGRRIVSAIRLIISAAWTNYPESNRTLVSSNAILFPLSGCWALRLPEILEVETHLDH